MPYTLKVQPEGGELYELTHNYEHFTITRIEGLDPPVNSINISTSGNLDGGVYNSSRLNTRNVVITAALNGDIEANRYKVFELFPIKSKVTIWFSDRYRTLKAVGYVEQPLCDPFELRETAQISLICPDPYWHDATETTAELAAFEPVTIDNTGDASTGFSCTVEFSADDPPSVTLAEASDDLQAAFPFRRNVFLQPMNGDTPVAFDPETQKITELTAAFADVSNILSAENIVKEDDTQGTNAVDYIRVTYGSDVLGDGSYTVQYAIASIGGGSMETVECTVHESAYFSNSISPSIYNCNINFDDVTQGVNFDPNTDVYKLYLRNASGWVEPDPASYTLIQTSGFYANFGYNLIGAGYTAGKFVVYHDTRAVDIRSVLELEYFSETRTVRTDWSANCYEAVPVGYNPAKDVPYVNGTRVTAADVSTCYIVPASGTAVQRAIVYGDPGNVTFRYVYSLNSDDITAYTDTQIDAGLIGTEFTEGLTIWNDTTGDWMQFKNTRFQLGDVLEICTVKGQLRAAITEREGQAADISLLSDVFKNGYFFQLAKGANEIQITATSGSENVSATLTAEFLYGGA